MTVFEKQTKIDALNMLRRLHRNNGNVDKVAEIDEQLSKIEIPAESVEKPKTKRQTKTVK